MERSQFIKFIGTLPYGAKIRAGLISIYDKIAKAAGIDKATQAEDGLMSKEDKKKLDGLANYTLPNATESKVGGVKQAAKVTKPADDTNANLKAVIDSIIDAMTAAGQMKA